MPVSSVEHLLSIWRNEQTIASNIVDWHTEAERSAQTLPLPTDMHPDLQKALQQRGLNSLYTHQVESWQAVKSGKNIVVVTGTASGKTFCYTLPILDTFLSDPKSTALFFFPTKALTQD
jgi:DEAD/DEAH box helicase domain-containing protein